MFITNTVLGGRGFSVGGGGAAKEYLCFASGYPLTLTKTLAKSPESITVYGADGGVGDKTANLFNKTIRYANPAASLLKSNSVYLTPATYTLHIGSLSNTSEWRLCFKLWDDDSAATTSGIQVDYSSSASFRVNNNLYIMISNTSQTRYTMQFTLEASRYIAFSLFYGNTTESSRANEVMLNIGTTALPYELYGYKIPVLFGALPAGYTELSYIEATGTQYIDTGISPTINLQIDYKVRFVEGATGSSPLIGARTGTTNESRFIPIGYTGTATSCRTVLGGVTKSEEIDFGIDYTGSFQPQNNVSIINGVTYDLTGHGYVKRNNFNLYLFAISGYGDNLYLSKGRMYYCRIYDNGVLVRNFIPAKRNSDNTIGMYDTINGIFYTNANSGDAFVAGAEVPNKTINLYSDVALGEGDSLIVDQKAKTATRGTTDISALQDFDQDWKLPKADELTVTAGTTVQPESMEIAYYSSVKG